MSVPPVPLAFCLLKLKIKKMRERKRAKYEREKKNLKIDKLLSQHSFCSLSKGTPVLKKLIIEIEQQKASKGFFNFLAL